MTDPLYEPTMTENGHTTILPGGPCPRAQALRLASEASIDWMVSHDRGPLPRFSIQEAPPKEEK